jgi:tripartite ATP-independent transporter DctM subunit
MNFWSIIFVIIILFLIGTPLFTVFAGFTLYAFASAGIDTSAVIIELYRIADTPMLVAIPQFIFAGCLLAESGASKRLVNLAQALFGWSTGGLAIVTLLTCAVFTAFTGASGVTILALGGMLYPVLLNENYPDKFSLGLVTASGNIGLLFPPSLAVILYGIIAQVNIDKLYIAGIIPGMLLIVILSAYSIRVGAFAKVPKIPFLWSKIFAAAKAAAWEIPLPIIIIGGIYSGQFTTTEAAAVTAFYVFIVEVFVYRDLHLVRDIPRVIKESMMLVGATISILGIAFALTNYLVDQQVPQMLLDLVRSKINSPITFLLILNFFLLIVGMVMEMFPAIIVVVPLILPIAKEYGIDPVHMGIIFLVNLEIAYLVPPFGLNLFLSSLRFHKPVFSIARAVLPFLLLELIVLLIITYIPQISLWLLHGS